jgi:hypothetical protein
MKKYLPVAILLVFLLIGGGAYLFKRSNANDEVPDLMETPPVVSKINSLAISKRPYVMLIPHKNSARCNGVDMQILDLKNGEEKVEYELEYTTEKLIQGVFGRREFSSKEEKHQPLEFGTCSKGRCRCDDDITGGSLKLSFTGKEDYVLKGDFSVNKVGDEVISSRDARLKILVGSAIAKGTDVLVMSTFGLPSELTEKVILGPYGIYAQNITSLKNPVTITLQSHDVVNGKIQFWDGKAWKKVDADISEDKAEFELNSLGVIVLTEK